YRYSFPNSETFCSTTLWLTLFFALLTWVVSDSSADRRCLYRLSFLPRVPDDLGPILHPWRLCQDRSSIHWSKSQEPSHFFSLMLSTKQEFHKHATVIYFFYGSTGRL